MSKIQSFVQSVLSSSKGTISSKRFFGGIGIVLVMCIITYLVIKTEKEPDILQEFMWMCGALIGLDTFKGIFSSRVNNEQNEDQNLI